MSKSRISDGGADAADEFSSPACLMHEVSDVYMGYADKAELIAFLDELLEAERAAARVALESAAAPGEDGLRELLGSIEQDKTRSCTMLLLQIRALGGEPSTKTAVFYDKAMAIADLRERMIFLNLGRGRVAKKLRAMLPRVRAPVLHTALADMLRSMPTDETPERAATWEEIRHWRERKREELIESRMALAVETRQALAERALERLVQAVDLKHHRVLGFCWPMRGEFDVRGLARRHLAAGGEVAIPVVVERSAPVEFWRWQPGVPMTKGIWDIPIPKERAVMTPDVLLVPLVGFDPCGFRLGYGGGYFDRTLAAARRRPYAIGLGYEDSLLPTIYPQGHDIPMDLIVTDRCIHRVALARSRAAPS